MLELRSRLLALGTALRARALRCPPRGRNSRLEAALRRSWSSITQVRLEHLPIRLHGRRRTFGEHASLYHADHARTELHDEVHVVLDDDEASALLAVHREQQLAQFVDEARVDAR